MIFNSQMYDAVRTKMAELAPIRRNDNWMMMSYQRGSQSNLDDDLAMPMQQVLRRQVVNLARGIRDINDLMVPMCDLLLAKVEPDSDWPFGGYYIFWVTPDASGYDPRDFNTVWDSNGLQQDGTALVFDAETCFGPFECVYAGPIFDDALKVWFCRRVGEIVPLHNETWRNVVLASLESVTSAVVQWIDLIQEFNPAIDPKQAAELLIWASDAYDAMSPRQRRKVRRCLREGVVRCRNYKTYSQRFHPQFHGPNGIKPPTG